MKPIQSISLNSIRNARELGGYPAADGRTVKKGVLLRTAALYGISDEDTCRLTDTYRLEHIIDLRMPMEIAGAADPAIKGAQYHHLDVLDEKALSDQGGDDFDLQSLDVVQLVAISEQSGMLNEYMYIGFLTSPFGKKAYSEFLDILLSADPDRAVLWHCTSGKDRTGLGAMLLLSALGVDESVIIDDYLLTNTFNAPRINATRQHLESKGYDPALIEKAVVMYDAVNGQYMKNVLAFLKKNYGSVTDFIRGELHKSLSEINSLKEKYLV